MKAIKLFTLMLVALVGMTACSNDDKNHQTLSTTYMGYVYADFAYATNYYSGTGKMTEKDDDGKISIVIENDVWGEATFENVQKMGDVVNGIGTLTVPARRETDGKPTIKPVTLSGTETDLIITASDMMDGGTIIHFYTSKLPTEKMVGTFSGTNTVVVGGQFTYTADIDYNVTANQDGTINIEVPEYTLTGTPMGDLTLGAHTISNIAFERELDGFYRGYGYEGLQMHFKATDEEGNIKNGMDKDYYFGPSSTITITPINKQVGRDIKQGLKVENSFNLGRIEDGEFRSAMLYGIVATFEGAISSAK